MPPYAVPDDAALVAHPVPGADVIPLSDLVDLARTSLDLPIALLLLDTPPAIIARGMASEERPCSQVLAALAQASNPCLIEDARPALPGLPGIACYAAVPVCVDGDVVGSFAVMDRVPRALPADLLERLDAFARLAAGLVRAAHVSDAMTREARERDAALARYKKMYDRSSSLAKIGVWECELATGEISWTDGVYDIFDLPRGSVVPRDHVLALYTDRSRAEMETMRAKAIAEGDGFTLDVEIITSGGERRWVRLSADIECVDGKPVRIFGTKQDITLERQLMDRLRLLAECDPLTGIANRGVFESRLAEAAVAERGRNRLAALAIIDVDGFKQINDTFGHAAGDECLREMSRRLRLAFGEDALVARIGGDEFGVLAFGAAEEGRVAGLAARAIARLSQPFLWRNRPVAVSGSMGVTLAGGSVAPAQLFVQADRALYAAKEAGRNTYRLYDAKAHRLGPSGRRLTISAIRSG